MGAHLALGRCRGGPQARDNGNRTREGGENRRLEGRARRAEPGGKMQRSFIDARIDKMLEFCASFGARLPPFALWSESEYRADPAAAARILEGGLGWNI